jgi:amino acid adenylation domain-containing protein/non-ribosomal peptide synthase protein (TIGR01720 family)
LEYVGRLDQQVKVRGFRIEPGEVEAAIRLHPGVRACVALVREQAAEGQRLEAYVVAEPGAAGGKELREWLRERLPEYMVPSLFVLLDELPLLPNGKLDRRTLLQLGREAQGAAAGVTYVAPRNPIEETLAAVWSEVLRVKQVGIHDNFFDLGGHSLLATRVAARLRESFDVELPLRHVFEEPTVAGLASRIADSLRGGDAPKAPPREPRRRGGPLPLSFAQQRLWFLSQLEPDSPAYNVATALRLVGALDAALMEETFNEIVRRHEALRTTFTQVDGRPAQVVHPARRRALSLEDLGDLCRDEREARARRLALEESRLPFDLARGPLMRVRLLRLAPDEHVVLLTAHHIISDGWSTEIIFREVSAIYEALRRGEPSPLPEPQIQYADYALWQQEWLRGEVLEAELAYWKGRLESAPPQLELPTDYPRPAVQSSRGATESIALPAPVADAVRRLSRELGVTQFMALLAAFKVLLYRYTGEADIVVGTPVANRTRLETEDVVGIFVNTLALRTDLSGDPTFRGLAARVKETTLGAYAHQDTPFEKIVDELQLERNLSHTALFQVAFTFQAATQRATALGADSLTVTPLLDEGGTSKFDLTLSLSESPEGLDALAEYSTDLFARATIVRLLGHFRALLEALTANPDARLSSLSLAGPEETRRLLGEWSHTERKPLQTRCAYELFEEHAAATPDAPAVVHLEDRLTYGELNRRANQLARRLRRLGVGPEVAVGSCFEQGLDAVVSLLAVSKAGGVYVPLDPAFPKERLSYMIEDAGAPVLLTHERLAAGLPEYGGRVVLVDADAEEINGYDGENLPRRARPDNLMYVIYTSGSTGRPKGTGVSHLAATNHFLTTKALMGLGPDERVLQFYSLSFDGSLEQIGPSLVSGACLYLREKEVWGVEEFADRLRTWRLTVIDLPPAYLQQFLTYVTSRTDGFEHLRLVVTGGDVLQPEAARLWQQSPLKSVRLVNAYGPTEAVVTSVAGDVEPVPEGVAPRRVPIGRALTNRTTYVLDSAGRPTPAGVPGELCIGGPLLARGYLNRPELTAEKFVPDPFADEPGGRLYRTGDRARYLSDGRIEFLGRVDRQIKVRGFRIEAGEIEAALARHPAVREVAVATSEDAHGHVRLVAYVVLDERLAEARDKRPELWPSVGEYQVYDELLYSAMTYDEVRNEKYRAAIKQLVRDKVVLEIGTGKDAVLARFCAEAGARKVYAVEVLEASYRSAKELVASLGLADRIEVIHGDSFSVELPEQVDVCVSEIIGTIGSSEGTVPVLDDARRFLKEGGVNIPQRCLTKIAAVQLPDELLRDPRLEGLPGAYARKVFEHVGHRFDVRLCLNHLPKENLISDAGVFEDLDFKGRGEPASREEVTLTISRRARLDGFLLWINLHTAEGIVIDSLEEQSNWLPVYFPAFGAGLEVDEGDVVRAVCSSTPSDNQVNPDYRVKGSVLKRGGEVVEFDFASLHHEPSYRQTEFYQRLFPEDDAGADQDVSAGASDKDLRDFLAARLPQYMVPSAFVRLEKLPLTPSGKVDRRALPAPTRFGAESEAGYVPPRTPAEETLAEVWREVLGVERVGVHDNFFHLGGDSILSIQIIARANQAGLRLTPRQLFQHQTVAALAAVAGTADAVVAEQGGVSGEAPLTPIQHWFFASHETELHHFNQSVLLEVRPGVDVALLREVMQQMLAHHDALRLRFTRGAAGWRQTHAEVSEAVSFTRIDLTGLAPEEQSAAVESNAEEIQRSLDLSAGPIVRAALFDMGADKPGRLLLVIHHLAVDGVTWRILLEDIHLGYEQLARGEAVRLAPKTTSFKRWAERLSEYARSIELRQELPYWLGLNHPGLGRLPFDLPGPNTIESARTIEVSLDPVETRALLQEVPRAYRADINSALLSALAEACGEWAGGDALLVDLEGHGREEVFDDVDVSRTVGWFTSVFPVLLETGGGRGGGEALLEVKESLRRVPHKGLGYGVMKYLGADAEVAGGLESLPAAEILFNYFGQLDQVLAESPLFAPARESGGATQSARHGREHLLEVNASVAGGRLRVAWTYSENVHRRETIERLAAGFAGALRALVADCRAVEGAVYTPSDFPLAGLDRGQLARLTQGMGQVEDIYPLSPVQQGMFFQSLYPGEGAYVEQTSGALRGEVDVRALELAWQRAVERHGVLRTSFHLEDFDEPVQVVHARASMPFDVHDVSLLSPAEQRAWLAAYLEADRRRGFDLARPPLLRVALVKTGPDEHQFVWTFHHLLLDGWSVSLLFKEVMTLYAALSEGAEARLEPPRQFGDYIAWLRRQDLPAAESFWRASLRGFRRPTRLGTDRAPGSPQEERFGDAHVSLSAETTARLQALARQHQLTLNTLLQGAWALVLGHYGGEPDVLFGVTVSGRPAELARIEAMVGMFINTLPVRVRLPQDESVAGWLAALQAQQAEMRQYDYTPLSQVQGWGEVPRGVPLFESLLIFENYPVQTAAREQRSELGVADVQALTRTKHRLTVVAAPGAEVGLNIAYSLRWFDDAQVEALLGHFKLLLESMAERPEQSLGSLPRWEESERLRLFGPPDDSSDAAPPVRATAPPRTPTEEVLAAIWTDLMGVERIGVEDDFFDLGGHSLLATQLVSRVRQVFRVELPLRSLFDAPTIAGTAARIEQLLRAGTTAAAPPLVSVPREGGEALPVSFAQQRLWFLHQLNPLSPAYNVPVSVRLTGVLRHEALERALGEIVRRHEVLRTVYTTVRGEPVQVITPPRPFHLPVVNLGGLPPEAREAEARRLATEEAERPFDLAAGPMLRAQLLRLGEGEYVALLTMHHIVSDGWSIGVLVREVVTLYAAYARGEASPLPELTIQYADYAAWQRGWLQGEVLESHLEFWRRQLSGVAQLNLPTDFPRPPVPSFRAGVQSFTLSKEATEGLKALTRREGCTLFMTLLAAFQTLLHRYTQQDDVVVGTDLANRTQAEVEPLIGFFVNMLAMRTSFAGNPTFRELLARARQMALDAYAHQDLPFEKLVAALQLERDLSRFPVFQAVLVLQNEPDQARLELPGLSISPVESDSHTVKFDLILFLAETEEGLRGHLDYSTDLFTAETARRMTEHLAVLLRDAAARPDTRVGELEMFTEEERGRRMMREQEREGSERQKLRGARRKAVNLSEVSPVRFGRLGEGALAPALVEPNLRHVDLAAWGAESRDTVESLLLKHGAVLFRGFGVRSVTDFEEFAQRLGTGLFGEYGDLPREGQGGKVYGSTPYPNDQAILFHNESSHMHRWPLRIWFYCVRPAERGGETPIADCREVLRRLDPSAVARFREKKIMYVRNYTEGFDVSWRDFFRTDDRAAVEEYCRRAGLEFEWKPDGGLRTRQVCEAVRVHPRTGVEVFFNQIQLHHIAFLEESARRAVVTLFPEEDYPRHVYYGDGSPIEPAVIEAVSEAYARTAVSFAWQERDVLMLDNMLTAHARNPYEGARKILVAMGEMVSVRPAEG